MRKLTLFMSTSLDGFIAGADKAENEELEYPDSSSSEDHIFANELFASADTVLFGRVTYEGFIGYWDTLDLSDSSVPSVEVEFARIFRQLKRVVFSRTLSHVVDNTILINDTIAADVLQLKQLPGKDMLLVCGPDLLATLIELSLVDELQILISPKALGSGQSLYGSLTKPMKLILIATREFSSGSVLHHYRIRQNSQKLTTNEHNANR